MQDFVSLDLTDVIFTGARLLGLGLAPPSPASSHRALLLRDGLRLLATAVGDLTGGEVDLVPPRVSCSDADAPFVMGQQIMDALIKVSAAKRRVV